MGDISLPLEGFIALDWSMLFLASLFVFLRLWVRSRRRGIPSTAAIISDVFVACSYVSAIVFVGVNTWKNSLRMKYRDQKGTYYGVPKNLSGHLLKVCLTAFHY